MTYFVECNKDADCTDSASKCAADKTCKCGNAADAVKCSGDTPKCVDDNCKGNSAHQRIFLSRLL